MHRRDTEATHEPAHETNDPEPWDGSTLSITPEMATVAATSETDGEDPGRNDTTGDQTLPNTLTIIGRGVPTSVNVTVDGVIEPVDDAGSTVPDVLSGTSVECTVETETCQYRFTGELTDVTFVDRAITGSSPGSLPNVHVEYETPDRIGSHRPDRIDGRSSRR